MYALQAHNDVTSCPQGFPSRCLTMLNIDDRRMWRSEFKVQISRCTYSNDASKIIFQKCNADSNLTTAVLNSSENCQKILVMGNALKTDQIYEINCQIKNTLFTMFIIATLSITSLRSFTYVPLILIFSVTVLIPRCYITDLTSHVFRLFYLFRCSSVYVLVYFN